MVYRTAATAQVLRETPLSVEARSELRHLVGGWGTFMTTAVFYSGKKSPHSAIKQPLVGVMFTLYSAYRDAT